MTLALVRLQLVGAVLAIPPKSRIRIGIDRNVETL